MLGKIVKSRTVVSGIQTQARGRRLLFLWVNPHANLLPSRLAWCVTSLHTRRCSGSLDAMCGGLSALAAPMSSQRACDIRTYQRPCGGGSTVYFKLPAFLSWPPLGKHMLASVMPNLRAMLGTAVSLCVVFASSNTSHFPLSLATHHAGDRETNGILSGHAVRFAGLPCFQHVLSMTPSRCL